MATLQQSEVRATQNGINALEQAFTGVQNCRQDVENTKANLARAHQGADGKAYQELLTLWDGQAEVISKNLRDVVDTLNETLKAQGVAQGSATDSVNQAYSESQAVFDTLHG